jgi:hypothetical protein
VTGEPDCCERLNECIGLKSIVNYGEDTDIARRAAKVGDVRRCTEERETTESIGELKHGQSGPKVRLCRGMVTLELRVEISLY